jgi:hypothetical protein
LTFQVASLIAGVGSLAFPATITINAGGAVGSACQLESASPIPHETVPVLSREGIIRL